jgi:SAM-dependent methyltransferase
MKRTAFSCVVDNTPLLLAQAFLWVNCLKQIRRIRADDIFVHIIGIDDEEFVAWLNEEKINVIEVTPFHPLSPHSNKIQQLQTLQQTNYDTVVLLDCDTAFIGDHELPAAAPIRASIVNYPNPPEPILERIFAEALGVPPEWLPAAFPRDQDRLTDRNNCNGGVYICDRKFLTELEDAWRSRALWSLAHLNLFEPYGVHVDQVSFALAMRDLRTNVEHLDLAWNFPTNLPAAVLPDLTPQIIHYHGQITPRLQLKTIGLGLVDAAITHLNDEINNFIRNKFLNTMWWNFHYYIEAEVGSARETNDKNLDYTHKVLSDALRSFDDPVVVDVGCGDLEATKFLPIRRYHGLDISEGALSIARNKRPDWQFHRVRIGDAIQAGDVILCIDVLIHQPSLGQFLATVKSLTSAARQRLVVTGYEQPPTSDSPTTRYYLPISEALRSTGAFSSIAIVGESDGRSVIVADKRPPQRVQPEWQVQVESPGFDHEQIQATVQRGQHSEVAGGQADEIGPLQYRFLLDRGLQRQHTFLDIGCGNLRDGVHFIRYLDAGNYIGVDIDQSLLDAGFEIELKGLGLQDKLPRENLVCLTDFEFEQLGRSIDFAIASSLFTRLTFNQIRRCLGRLASVMRIGGRFFATFFELPRDANAILPYAHDPGGVVTYDTSDPYHYKLADFFYAASGLPWQIRYIGDCQHPRGQHMLEFVRTCPASKPNSVGK